MSCVPCSMMDLLGATVGREIAEACPCKTAIGLLVRLGAVHTAKMHAQGATDHPEKWPNRDWDLHEDEEEKLFFPLLPKTVAKQFIDEHRIFRAERKKFGKIISLDLLRAHAARENMWAEKILMDSESGARVGRVGEEISASDQVKPGEWTRLTSYRDNQGREWTFKLSDPPAPTGSSDWFLKDGTMARIPVGTPNWLSGDYKSGIGSLLDDWIPTEIQEKKQTPKSGTPKPGEAPKKSGFKLEPTPLTLAAGFAVLLGFGFVVAGFLSRRVRA